MKKLLATLAVVSTFVFMSSAYAADLPAGWAVVSADDEGAIFENKDAGVRVGVASVATEGITMPDEDFAKATAKHMKCSEDVQATELGYRIVCEANNTLVYVSKNDSNDTYNVITATCSDDASCTKVGEFIGYLAQ